MEARWLGTQIISLAECGSTNDEAARLARAGARHGTVVIAVSQLAGRGRDGRVWASPPGNLYMSAVLRPPLALPDVPAMTLAIGIGVCDAARASGAAAGLKWPNDVLVGSRKLAGVLVEAQSQGTRLEAVVVGIGVNLVVAPDPTIATRAITLAEATGVELARDAFVPTLLAHVERWIDRYIAVGVEAIIPAWQARMVAGLSARATVDGDSLVGELAGLDLDGALLLKDETGRVHRVRSGDVEVVNQL
jgi:BirA family transcriptional regulator, biotin operon repressor / biotin---[acetyl-CoA-carboxylase] ligase